MLDISEVNRLFSFRLFGSCLCYPASFLVAQILPLQVNILRHCFLSDIQQFSHTENDTIWPKGIKDNIPGQETMDKREGGKERGVCVCGGGNSSN